ncbi:MAG: hypothetical protein ACW98D_06540 [Promethearchaeota archaeon]|jgi:hypothetical protein
MLTYNSHIDSEDKSKITDTKIRIPLTPVEVNPYLLYHLFEVLYPKFINDHNNILDIIISDDGKNVINLYLYETKKAGIHESIEKLPHDIIKFHRKDLVDINRFYSRILDGMVKKKGIRVSSIRIIKEKVIHYINQFCTDIEDTPLDVLLSEGFELIQKLFEQELFIVYPEPNLFRYLKELIIFLDGRRLSSLFRFIYDLLPEFNIAFILGAKNLPIVLHLQKLEVSKSDTSYLRLKLLIPEEIGISNDISDKNEILSLVQQHLKTDKAYYLNQNNIFSLLTEIINLPVKVRGENLNLLIQKILFGIRSFENLWYLIPRPVVYNTLLRFFLRLFGFNLNLRKLSHWAIPELISNIIGNNFGLNSKILFIISDIANFNKLNFSDLKYLEKAAKHLFIVEIENNTIDQIYSVRKEDFIIEKEIESLESIRLKFSEKYGYLSNIIILDKLLLQSLIKNFVFEHSKIAPRSKIKILKMLKKPRFFYIFPEIPPYRLIKKKGIISLIKLLLPIIIDKHEF